MARISLSLKLSTCTPRRSWACRAIEAKNTTKKKRNRNGRMVWGELGGKVTIFSIVGLVALQCVIAFSLCSLIGIVLWLVLSELGNSVRARGDEQPNGIQRFKRSPDFFIQWLR